MYSHEQLKLMDAAAISISSQRHIQSVIEELIETALAAAPTPAEAPADVARDAALYCAVQRACAELPEGWEIRIELERSAGTVSLVNPDGEDVDYPSDHEYMASDINDAIDSAIAAEKGGAK